MDKTNRRGFIKSSAAAGIGLTAACGSSETEKAPVKMETKNKLGFRTFGSTGFEATEIGFGCMNMRDPELLHAGIDSGINYVDTAFVYMNGENQKVVGEVMQTKRDKVFLTTKVGLRFNVKDIESEIETCLKSLKTDHVDLLLFHLIDNREQILNDDAMKLFDNARKKGQTRFVGISSHDQIVGLDSAVESKFWEAVLVPYNYFSPPEVTESIKNAREAGLAIIGMKNLITATKPRKVFPDIRKDNSEWTSPQQALIKWVLNNPNIDTTIPGVTSFEQLADNMKIMGTEMTSHDMKIVREYAANIKSNYCCGLSGCTGCKEKCPKGVEVNELNRCLGYAYGYGDMDLAQSNYDNLLPSSKVEVCADCSECVVKCINGMDLTENIHKARELFA
jgi:uncharacterized protein